MLSHSSGTLAICIASTDRLGSCEWCNDFAKVHAPRNSQGVLWGRKLPGVLRPLLALSDVTDIGLLFHCFTFFLKDCCLMCRDSVLKPWFCGLCNLDGGLLGDPVQSRTVKTGWLSVLLAWYRPERNTKVPRLHADKGSL
jgi:hypothetical protein